MSFLGSAPCLAQLREDTGANFGHIWWGVKGGNRAVGHTASGELSGWDCWAGTAVRGEAAANAVIPLLLLSLLQ